jgi:hypothetical protein
MLKLILLKNRNHCKHDIVNVEMFNLDFKINSKKEKQ